MKIDLHCHTRNIKSGDGPGREVTDELFEKKVKDSGVEILAITNHNIFDDEQFVRLKDRVEGVCILWPGVEFDIGYDDDKRYHLLVICNPKNITDFKDAVKQILRDSTPEGFIGDIRLIIERFEPLDCIFLPHFQGKSPAIPLAEWDKLNDLLSNKNRLIAEASNVRSMGIFINHGINSIVGSDIKDWSIYPGKDALPELRLRIDEFEHLCKLLDRDSTLVKCLLDKNKSTSYDVYPNPKNRNIKERLSFYKEVNVIFGDKGTGKSEVIKSLRNKLKSEETPYAEYISGETKEYLDDLLKTDDMEREASLLGVNNCEAEFSLIKHWGDKNPTPMSDYIDHFESQTNKESVKRIGWSRMSDLADDADVRLESVRIDLENIVSGRDSLNEIDKGQYLSNEDEALLDELLNKLESAIVQQEKTIDIEERAVRLVNFTLSRFRRYTSVKSNSAERPQNCGFGKFAKSRLTLKHSVNKIAKGLSFNERKVYIPLGDIGEKGKIEIEVRHRMLNDHPNTKSDHKEYGGNITKLHKAKEKIQKVKRLTLRQDLENDLVALKDHLDDCGITSIDDFVGIYRQTVDKNREPYSPSNGERSIIFIQRALDNDEASIFLLDEPEQSMANSYIDDIIRPKIIELGQQKKTVIMATHNANLAVRTLPYTTIYRSHGADGYKTFEGNPFTNRLTNIRDETETICWQETSMKILEGGREAFYDREGIYESGR